MALDTAVPQQTGQELVENIEVCRCPVGYRGTSCEVCINKFLQKMLRFNNWTCFRCAITSTIMIRMIVPLVCLEYANVVHVRKMLNPAAWEQIGALYATVNPVTMETDALNLVSLKKE